MNKLIFIIISIILVYLFIFFVPFAWTAIFAAIPLYALSVKRSAVSGFLIGFISPLSIYLIYPLNYVQELSGIIGGIVSMPSFLVAILFPLMYAIIMALSALIWSGVHERFKK